MDFADTGLNETASDGRTRILRAARDLFTQTGFKTASMQQIADAAGVNKATLYHHFADKEDLFVEVLRQEFAHGHAQINESIVGFGTLRSQLVCFALHIFDNYRADVGRLMADLREHVSAPRREELLGQGSPPWTTLKSVFEQAQARGEIRDIDTTMLGRLFFVMISSQLGWSKFGAPELRPDERTANTVVDILLNGIALHAESPTVSAATAATVYSAPEPDLL